ncbi:MAG: hypothetical protein ACFFDF_18480 [Candidatus Odinarchaeota archaeon]
MTEKNNNNKKIVKNQNVQKVNDPSCSLKSLRYRVKNNHTDNFFYDGPLSGKINSKKKILEKFCYNKSYIHNTLQDLYSFNKEDVIVEARVLKKIIEGIKKLHPKKH